MYQDKIREIQSKLEQTLKPERYRHTLGVMYTAASMAFVYECDLEQTMLAALLHDCAKCMSHEKMICLCESHNISLSEMERNNPGLLHAKAGIIVAREEYEIKDEAILAAIEFHTTGKPDMTLLEKIIFIADYIEPGRFEAPNLPRLRKMAFTNINQCIIQIAKDTLDYVNARGFDVDPTTEATYMYYKEIEKENEYHGND